MRLVEAADLLPSHSPVWTERLLLRQVKALCQHRLRKLVAELPPEITAEEAIELLREQEPEVETVYYIYVLDRSEKLRGVFSLRQLLMAPPERKVRDFMNENPVAVRTGASEEEITQVIAKYNLLALPVVGEDDRLHGIITIDDAIDLVLPLAWKKRLPRIFH